MKKNISINIFGTIYAIDEDAYQLLDKYINGMKTYFRNKEGGEEIADDIEHRVAELLWEEKMNGMEAVNIETVRNIINKIGNASEIDNNSETSEEGSNGNAEGGKAGAKKPGTEDNNLLNQILNHIKTRRLYRNEKSKVLGGVCSGLAEYFGGVGVTMLRLAVVMVFIVLLTSNFAASVVPIVYCLLWAIVPAAQTHEDWLRMKGEEVNAENIKKQIMDEASTQEKPQQKCKSGINYGGCMKTILSIALFIIIIHMMFPLVGLTITAVALLMYETGMLELPRQILEEPIYNDVMSADCMPILWVALVSGIIVLGIAIYALGRFIWGKGKAMTMPVKISMATIWLIALATLICSVSMCSMNINMKISERHTKDLTRNGIRLASDCDWDTLDENGWTITSMKNVCPRIIDTRSGFGGLPTMAFRIKRDTSRLPITMIMEKEEYYEEGDYILEVLAETKGNGAKVSLLDSDNDAGNDASILYETSEGKSNKNGGRNGKIRNKKQGEKSISHDANGIPAMRDGSKILASVYLGKNGERLDTMSWNYGKNLPIFFSPDSAEWESFAQYHEKWVYQKSLPFHHNSGNMKLMIDIDNLNISKVKIRYIQIRKL